MIGKELGSGMNREVYEYGGNPQFVVKIEVNPNGYFQNVMEYNFWDAVRDAPDMLKWIAPCVRISPHGNYLIQERTMPVTLKELQKKLPKVPTYLSDFKEPNWGRLPNGRIVCHDYGTHRAVGACSTKLVKAHWWD